jgi:hypothetical protein
MADAGALALTGDRAAVAHALLRSARAAREAASRLEDAAGRVARGCADGGER